MATAAFALPVFGQASAVAGGNQGYGGQIVFSGPSSDVRRLSSALCYAVFLVAVAWILAQISCRLMVRLKISLAAVESGSTQKYPIRSNW